MSRYRYGLDVQTNKQTDKPNLYIDELFFAALKKNMFNGIIMYYYVFGKQINFSSINIICLASLAFANVLTA